MIIDNESILIVDDHPVVLSGLELMIADIKPQSTITTVLSSEQALDCLGGNVVFDWIFIDVKLPGISGIELVDQLRKNGNLSNIIMLSSELTLDLMEEMLQFNINGILSKSFDKGIFLDCFEKVEQGKIFMKEEYEKNLEFYRQGLLRERKRIEEHLSSRQIEILTMIAMGCSNNEIAINLGISINTVKNHVACVMDIFEAKNRTHCVSEAQRLKLI